MKHKDGINDSRPDDIKEVPVAKKPKANIVDESDKLHLPESTAYQSALINFKVTALLDEVRVTGAQSQLVDDRFNLLKHSISKIKCKEPKQLVKQLSRVLGDLAPPMKGNNWQFVQPLSVSIGGSYALGFSPRKDLIVDVMMVVPKSYFREKDFLNMRYVACKLAYLTSIAEKLQAASWTSSVHYAYHGENVLRPILMIRPADCDFSFALHVLPEQGAFAVHRFHASKNNVRPRWLFREPSAEQDHQDGVAEGADLPATTHYNVAMLVDVIAAEASGKLRELIGQSNAIRDALLLLKVWLHQRQLDEGKSAVSGYVIATFVAELLKTRRLNLSSGCYQTFKVIMTALASCDWTSLPKSGLDHSPGADDFMRLKDGRLAFDVVLPDVLGCVNVCYQLHSSTYLRLKELAGASVKHMDSAEGDFEDLFLAPAPFGRQFDCYITLTAPEHLWSSPTSGASKFRPSRDDVVSHSGDFASAALPHLLALLRHATDKRLVSVDLAPISYPSWTIEDEPPEASAVSCIQLGLKFNSDTAFSIIEKGPPADDAMAKDFREFWGDKAELRRFHDGSICEAVVWPCKTVAARRNIVGRIVKFVLARHLDVPPASVHVTLRELDVFLRCPEWRRRRRRQRQRPTEGGAGAAAAAAAAADSDAYGTGEEQLAAAMSSFDVLSKRVRSACSSAGLPLSVVSLQGVTASFRAAEVFPVMPTSFAEDGSCKCAAKCGALEAVCVLEGSGKWPDDAAAIRRLRAVYLLKLGAELQRAHGLAARHHVDHLSVVQDGYLFSLRLAHRWATGEAAGAAADSDRAAAGYAAEDDDEAATAGGDGKAPSRVDVARLTSFLSGLHGTHASYGACARLAKRWTSAHLMSDDLVPGVALELLVAHVFVHPHPYAGAPGSPLIGFFRFLQLLATFDWQHRALIVNFNSELTAAECEALRETFKKERVCLPGLFIATPCDRHRPSLWTHAGPKPFALRRLVLLARETLRLVDDGCRGMQASSFVTVAEAAFRTSLDVCDVIIHLKLPAAAGHGDHSVTLPTDGEATAAATAGSSIAVAVDSVSCYVRELTEAYGHSALFLYDKYDCRLIGVLWKPDALQVHDFKSTHLDALVAVMEGDSAKTRLSLSTALEDFELIGRGLVDHVEVRRPKAVE